MLSILSMDGYNQGYERGIEHGALEIGAASVGTESKIGESDAEFNDGFYALTYTVDTSKIDDWTGGSTVLAFRGIDSTIDYLRGWLIDVIAPDQKTTASVIGNFIPSCKGRCFLRLGRLCCRDGGLKSANMTFQNFATTTWQFRLRTSWLKRLGRTKSKPLIQN